MRERARIQDFEPNELRAWVALAERYERDEFDRQTWALFDSARRFLSNPRMVERQIEEWLTRADCYELARLDLRCARIFLEGDGAMLLDALGHLASALRYRELARDRLPAVHDQPRERIEVYDFPRFDPDAVKVAAKDARAAAKASRDLEASGLVPFEAFGGTFWLKPDEIEEAQRIADGRARRRARREPCGELSIDDAHRWQALVDAALIRAGLPIDGDDDVTLETTVRYGGDGRLAPRARVAGNASAADYHASLEQLGLRVDEDGRWWVRPPSEVNHG